VYSFISVTNFVTSEAKLGVLYYFTVAATHIWSELRRLKSTVKSITCTQDMQSVIDNHSRLSQSMGGIYTPTQSIIRSATDFRSMGYVGLLWRYYHFNFKTNWLEIA